MEQFQIVSAVCIYQRCDLLGVKLGIISAVDTVFQLFLGKICQKEFHDFIGCLLISHLAQVFQTHIQFWNKGWDKQSATICQSF